MGHNPFLGPRAYGSAERGLFFGRDELAKQLCDAILTHRRVTIYGPNGAGKSSLLYAAVLPLMAEKHDTRVIRVEEWPESESPTARLASVLRGEFGISEIAAEESPKELVVKTVRSAARTSPRKLLVCLDHLEQVCAAYRSGPELAEFFECLDELLDLSFQTLHIVLVIRDELLPKLRRRLRHGQILEEHSVRVGPLLVRQAVEAAMLALAWAEAPQEWSVDEVHALMLQVRTPGQTNSEEAEVQAAHAQIVCRALFAERAEGKHIDVVDIEPILRNYLESVLKNLGAERTNVEGLLEAQVARNGGTRTLRSADELAEVVTDAHELDRLLKLLEDAAILRTIEHEGTCYFEIAHEGFARYVFLKRQARERAEKVGRERVALRERSATEGRQRRRIRLFSAVSIALTLGASVLGLWARKQQNLAEAAFEAAKSAESTAKLAEAEARAKAVEASDARLLVGFRELRSRGHVAAGLKLLHDVQQPEQAHEWIALANEGLRRSVLEVTLRGEHEPFVMAAWSHDGKRIAAGADNGQVWIWSVTGDGATLRLPIHQNRIVSVAWSPDDSRLLTASEDGSARVFAVDGSDKPRVFDPKAGPLRLAVYSPDGTRIAAIAADSVVRVWPVDGSVPLDIRGHLGELTSLAFFPDGKSILTTSADKTARISSVEGPPKVIVLGGHQGTVRHAAPSPDGKFVVTASDDKTVRVYPTAGGSAPVLLEGHGDAVIHAAWSPDGSRVVTTSLDKTVRNWASDGKSMPIVFSAEGMTMTSASFRKDGRYILTRSMERTIAVWPASGGSPLRIDAHDGPVVTAEWGPDGKRAMSASGAVSAGATRDATVKVWRLETLESLSRSRNPYFHSASILTDGLRAVAAFDDRSALLFQLDGEGERIRFSGHEGWVSGAFASADGSSILTTSFDKTARIWKSNGQGEAVVLRGSESAVRAGAFSPDGKRVVTVGDDKKIRIWKTDGGTMERELSGHTDLITSVTWSPDGVFVLTSSMDRTARVWRADGSRQPVILSGHVGGVVSAAWSPDSARVVTASEDHTAGVWNAATGQLLSSLEHTDPVLTAAFGADEKRVATSTVHHGIRVWKADGTEEPLELPVDSPVMSMMFLDGGRRIVAISEDDTIRKFIIDIEMLMGQLEAANRDCLSPQERVTYLGETLETAETLYEACERLAKKRPVTTGEEP